MTVLGPGATCCRSADCDIECDFVRPDVAPVAPVGLVTTPAFVSAPLAPPLQVIAPDETVRIDSTDKPSPDIAPKDPK